MTSASACGVDVAELAREPQRLRRPGAVLRPVVVDAAVRDGDKQLRPGRRRDGLGHQGERPVQVGLRLRKAEVLVEREPPPQQQRVPDRLGGLVELGERELDEREAALRLRRVAGGGHRLLEHPHVIGADLRRGVRHLLPKLEDAVEQHQPLRVRDHVRCLHRRPPGRGERARRVVRRVPVVRLLDVRPARRDKRRVNVDCLGEPGVHGGVLAWQQVRVHRLLDERVPERVPVPGRHQDVRRDGRADRGDELARVQPGDLREQRVARHAAARAGDAQHLLGVLRQPPHGLQQQVGERVGHHVAAVRAVGAGEQLLGEQRVALGALEDGVGETAVRRPAKDDGGEFLGLPAGERRQLGPLHPVDPWRARRAAAAADGSGAARRNGTSRRSAGWARARW